MNLASALLRHAAEFPHKKAIRDSRGGVSFGDLAGAARRVRTWLRKRGMEEGDHVALALSGRDFVAAYLGVISAGAVAVPLNFRSPAFEMERNLRVTDTSLLLCADGLGPKGSLGVKELSRLMSHAELVDFTDLDVWTASADIPGAEGSDEPEIVDRAPGDPCVLIMTGGATGDPRAAVLTHGSILANFDQLHSHPRTRSDPDDVALGALPMFHVYGLNVVLGYSLYAGASIAFPVPLESNCPPDSTPPNDPAVWAECIKRYGVTLVAGPPNMYARFLDSDVSDDTFEGVRYCTSGAAPLPGEVFDGFVERFSKPLWEGYGLTEASAVVASSRLMERPERGCVGLPLPGVRVEIKGNGEPAELGDHGEIWIRGPNVFAGYYGEPEATRESLVDGWLRTGDIGVLDEDNKLYIVDRAKDLIIVGGFNVYPAEVEGVLGSHPRVAEAAVVGTRGPHGDRIVAYIVPKPSGSDSRDGSLRDLSEESIGLSEELIEHVAAKLARYKVPHEIRLVEELPKSPLAKLRRSALQADN